MLTQNNGRKMPIFVTPCILPSHTGFKNIFSFYSITVDKKWTFLDYLPTSSCKRSLLTTPWSHSQEIQNSFKMFQKSSLFYTEYEHEQGKLGLQFFGLIWTLEVIRIA